MPAFSSVVLLVLIGLGVPGAVPLASAQSMRGSSGMRVDPGVERPVPRKVNRRDAARIARSLGISDVKVVSRMGRRWRVQGLDSRGRSMRVHVSSLTGEVLRISRR
jgi:hypothetical protein